MAPLPDHCGGEGGRDDVAACGAPLEHRGGIADNALTRGGAGPTGLPRRAGPWRGVGEGASGALAVPYALQGARATMRTQS